MHWRGGCALEREGCSKLESSRSKALPFESAPGPMLPEESFKPAKKGSEEQQRRVNRGGMIGWAGHCTVIKCCTACIVIKCTCTACTVSKSCAMHRAPALEAVDCKKGRGVCTTLGFWLGAHATFGTCFRPLGRGADCCWDKKKNCIASRYA